jgi:hypothetical protein
VITPNPADCFGDVKESLHDVLIEADRDLYLAAFGLLFGDDPPSFPFAETFSMADKNRLLTRAAQFRALIDWCAVPRPSATRDSLVYDLMEPVPGLVRNGIAGRVVSF